MTNKDEKKLSREIREEEIETKMKKKKAAKCENRECGEKFVMNKSALPQVSFQTLWFQILKTPILIFIKE